jgi:hypothetical protein
MSRAGTGEARRLRWITHGVLAAALAVLPTAAFCLYVCTVNGRTLYGDTPPQECIRNNVEIRELNPDGSPKRIIPPSLTPEQKKEKDQKKKRQDECNRRNKEQKQKNDALLQTYPGEDDLLAARDHALANEKGRIDQQRQKLAELDADRTRLENEAEFYVTREMPEELKRKLSDNDSRHARAQRAIDGIRAEMARISDQFDADLKHYRALVMGTAQPTFECQE